MNDENNLTSLSDESIVMIPGPNGKMVLARQGEQSLQTSDPVLNAALANRAAEPLPGQAGAPLVSMDEKNADKTRYGSLERLEAFHTGIIEAMIEGHSIKNIAEHLGIPVSQINDMAKAPLFQAELSRRREERSKVLDQVSSIRRGNAMRILEDALELAATEQVNLLHTATDPKDKQRAINNIWDKCYGKLGAGTRQDEANSQASRPGFVINNLNVQIVQQLKDGMKEVRELITQGIISPPPELSLPQSSPSSGQ